MKIISLFNNSYNYNSILLSRTLLCLLPFSIILGNGVAATGLGLNAASSINDIKTFKGISKTMSPFGSVFQMAEGVMGNNLLTRIGTDLLASSIWLNAETKHKWFN